MRALILDERLNFDPVSKTAERRGQPNEDAQSHMSANEFPGLI